MPVSIPCLRHLDANFVDLQKWQKYQICVISENLEWSMTVYNFADIDLHR